MLFLTPVLTMIVTSPAGNVPLAACLYLAMGVLYHVLNLSIISFFIGLVLLFFRKTRKSALVVIAMSLATSVFMLTGNLGTFLIRRDAFGTLSLRSTMLTDAISKFERKY